MGIGCVRSDEVRRDKNDRSNWMMGGPDLAPEGGNSECLKSILARANWISLKGHFFNSARCDFAAWFREPSLCCVACYKYFTGGASRQNQRSGEHRGLIVLWRTKGHHARPSYDISVSSAPLHLKHPEPLTKAESWNRLGGCLVRRVDFPVCVSPSWMQARSSSDSVSYTSTSSASLATKELSLEISDSLSAS